jgi:hypothetical protein
MMTTATSRTYTETGPYVRDDQWSLAVLMRATAIVVAVLVLFSGAGEWGWNTGRLPLPPLATMVVVFACAAMAVLLDISRLGSGAMWGWAIANAVVAMTAFLWSSGSEEALQEVRTRVLSSMQLVAYVVVLVDPRPYGEGGDHPVHLRGHRLEFVGAHAPHDVQCCPRTFGGILCESEHCRRRINRGDATGTAGYAVETT